MKYKSVEFKPCEREKKLNNDLVMLHINDKSTGAKFVDHGNSYCSLNLSNYHKIKKVKCHSLPPEIEIQFEIRKKFQYFDLMFINTLRNGNKSRIEFTCGYEVDFDYKCNLNVKKIISEIEIKLDKLKCKEGNFEIIYDEDMMQLYELYFAFDINGDATIENIVNFVCGILNEKEEKTVSIMLQNIKNGKK